MKYPCNLIKDILPLYHDQVLSEESVHIIEEHLEGCKECKAYYEALCDSDLIEPMAFDEEIEKKKADSYKKLFKRIMKKACQIVGTLVLVAIAVILALYLLIIAVLNFNAQASWEEHTDIKEYGLLEDGRSVLEGFDIWPDSITEEMKVNDYLLIHYNPFDSNYLGYLTVEYSEAAYLAEMKRLAEYPSTEYVGVYGAKGFNSYEVLAMKTSDTGFVYALSDGSNEIIYVGMIFPGYGMDFDYREYIPTEFLPEGLDADKDNPTRDAMLERFSE